MSEASDALEKELESMLLKHVGELIPKNIPDWLENEGITPGSKLIGAKRIGGKNVKTDVIAKLEHGEPIKISAKLSNAHYFGNWYGHTRFVSEFSEESFNKMTIAATKWANDYCKHYKRPFVGVSINFGKRSGATAQRFSDILTPQDVITIAKGYGGGDETANCLYVSTKAASNISQLINNLVEINEENINELADDLKIVYRTVDPRTEKSNLSKNSYTKFVPYERSKEKIIIENGPDLFKLGKFETVEPDRTNHNSILNELDTKFNIVIPRKSK